MHDQSLTQADGCVCHAADIPRDQTMDMLRNAGVEGAAGVAVYEILMPCVPDERCVAEVRHAVLRAADRLAGVLGPDRDQTVRPLAALLAVLESMPGKSTGMIADEMAACCNHRCQRPAPRGRRYQKALISARETLIDARHGWSLEIHVESGSDEPQLTVTLVDGETEHASIVLHVEDVAVLGGFAARLQRLAQLAIVRKLGPNIESSGGRRGPLRIPGLRLRGSTQAWSDYHNAIDRPPLFGHPASRFMPRTRNLRRE